MKVLLINSFIVKKTRYVALVFYSFCNSSWAIWKFFYTQSVVWRYTIQNKSNNICFINSLTNLASTVCCRQQ